MPFQWAWLCQATWQTSSRASLLLLPLHAGHAGKDRRNTQSCTPPARLHAGIFPFLVLATLTPCLLSHVCNGVIRACETAGSVKRSCMQLTCSESLGATCHLAARHQSRKRGRWDLTREWGFWGSNYKDQLHHMSEPSVWNAEHLQAPQRPMKPKGFEGFQRLLGDTQLLSRLESPITPSFCLPVPPSVEMSNTY